jgi:hypothetical protein
MLRIARDGLSVRQWGNERMKTTAYHNVSSFLGQVVHSARVTQRQLKRFHTLSGWAHVIGFLMIIGGAAVSLMTSNNPQAVAVAVILFAVALYVNMWIQGWSVGAELEYMRETTENAAACIYVGDALEGLDEAAVKAGEAKAVRNTFVLFKLADDEGELRRYWLGIGEMRKKLVAQVVKKRQGTWTDIFSPEALARNRFELQEQVDDMHRENGAGYEARCLKVSYPIVNFMIFEYSDKNPDVLFGWGFHSEQEVGPVYSSAAPHLVRMFENYWETLEQDSRPIHTHPSLCTNNHQLSGAWLNVSYAEDGTIENMAAIDIRVDGRALRLSGWMVKNKRDEGSFISKATYFDGQELWFTYKRQKDGEIEVGASQYKFVPLHRALAAPRRGSRTPNGLLYPNSFTGKFFRETSKGYEVYGKRLKDEDASFITEHNEIRIQQLLHKHWDRVDKRKPAPGDWPFSD